MFRFLGALKRFISDLAFPCLPNASNTPITSSNEADFFNYTYRKPIYATIYDDFPLWMMIDKVEDFTGKQSEHKVELDYGGSTGFGTLPTAYGVTIDELDLTHKKLYARLYLDGLAWEQSKNDEGAMEEMSKFEIRVKTKSFKRTLEFALWGNADGALGTGDGSTPTGSAAAPVIIITAATFNAARWHTKMIINVGSATDNYLVTAVNTSTRAITLSRLDGSVDLTSGAFSSVCYLQGSKDIAFTGVKKVCSASSSTLYGITVGRGWQATQIAASSAQITPSILQQAVLNIKDEVSETPNLIACSTTQYRKLLAYAEHLKAFQIDPKLPTNKKGKVMTEYKYLSQLSYSGVALATDQGLVPVISSRFIDSDTVYLLNTNYMKFCSTPKGIHLKDQDGTVFIRSSTTDEYEGRMALYGDLLMVPTYQGQITGLATT